MGKWENGQMGKWGNGQMGKWANGEVGNLLRSEGKCKCLYIISKVSK